jgi:hypothetical protein
MCNPKPGSRCVTDSAKPYEKSLAEFKDLCSKLIDADGDEITDNYTDVEYDAAMDKLRDLADDLNTKKIFFAAALAKSEGALDEDPKKAATAQRKCIDYLNAKEAELSGESEKLLNQNLTMTNRKIVETAIFLNKFQETADKDRKGMGKFGTQLRTARFMSEHGVDAVKNKLQRELDADRDAKLATKAKGMNPTMVNLTHKIDSETLARAAEIARNDANAVLDRDIKKNSFETDWQERDIRKEVIQKNRDGSFTFTVSQTVNAPNLETALRRNGDSFNLKSKDMQVTFSPSATKNDAWDIESKYVADPGETLPEAASYQRNIWKGTPEFRKKKRN